MDLSEKMRIAWNEWCEKARELEKAKIGFIEKHMELLNIYFTNTTK